ncbi:MAG: accessory factor UbiK family protein [Proteobacteria bacterium]|nr:accessory factor UbiK family protein [Pseudomonadota bacterium]
MQTDNRILDGLAKVFTDAAGAAQSVRNEMDTFVRHRLEKLVADMDFVPREEFDAVKAMAAKARGENERLEARIAALEAKLPKSLPQANPTPDESKSRTSTP